MRYLFEEYIQTPPSCSRYISLSLALSLSLSLICIIFYLQGGTLEVRMTGLDTCYKFNRPDDMDSLLDHVSFEHLLTKLDGYSTVAVFVSLLVERRIIFIADKLATLSATTQAIMAVTNSSYPPPFYFIGFFFN